MRIPIHDGQERRGAPRIPICLPVACECDGWAGLAHTKDISESGLFLISERLPSPATGFSLELQLPGRLGRLQLRAGVVRIQAEGPRGFGLRFEPADQRGLDALRELAAIWGRAFGATGEGSGRPDRA